MIAASTAVIGEQKTASKPGPPASRWRTAAQERAYWGRLVEALRAAGRRPAGPRDVKEAADSALALTARGRSRWSRAILLNRRRRRFLSRLFAKAGGKGRRGGGRPKPAPPPGKGSRVRDRLRVLGRLVPGCRKLSAPSLLEETVDYVAALEMQVKAMRALANALAAAAAAAAATPAATEGERPEI